MRLSPLPEPAAVARLITRRCGLRPTVGIILGSGFGAVADAVKVEVEFAFRELPGFPEGSVPGHSARLVLGHWQNVPVAVLKGRAHYYEGFELHEVTFPTRVLAALGITELLVTNAAGAINSRYRAGDFMVISDHLNFMGANPLRGPVAKDATRFVDLTRAYDVQLQRRLRSAAVAAGVRAHVGIYLAVSGPNYETPAEIRAFRRMGADAVGMSTVPEVMVARQCGLRVAGLSCLTNVAAGRGGRRQTVSHEEVLETTRQREGQAVQLIATYLQRRPS